MLISRLRLSLAVLAFFLRRLPAFAASEGIRTSEREAQQ